MRLTVRGSATGEDLNLIHPSDSVRAAQNEGGILVVENARCPRRTDQRSGDRLLTSGLDPSAGRRQRHDRRVRADREQHVDHRR